MGNNVPLSVLGIRLEQHIWGVVCVGEVHIEPVTHPVAEHEFTDLVVEWELADVDLTLGGEAVSVIPLDSAVMVDGSSGQLVVRLLIQGVTGTVRCRNVCDNWHVAEILKYGSGKRH